MIGFVLTGIGAVRQPRELGQRRRADRPGSGAVLLGHLALQPAPRPPARLGDRSPDRGACVGITGRLARENTHPQPGPHRGDRRGTDDRAGARVLRDACSPPGSQVRSADAIDNNFQGELILQNINGFSTIPAKRSRDAAQAARGRRRSRRCSFASSRSPRRSAVTCACRGSTRARSPRCWISTSRRAPSPTCVRSTTARRSSTTPGRRATTSRWGTSWRCARRWSASCATGWWAT